MAQDIYVRLFSVAARVRADQARCVPHDADVPTLAQDIHAHLFSVAARVRADQARCVPHSAEVLPVVHAPAVPCRERQARHLCAAHQGELGTGRWVAANSVSSAVVLIHLTCLARCNSYSGLVLLYVSMSNCSLLVRLLLLLKLARPAGSCNVCSFFVWLFVTLSKCWSCSV